MMHTVAGYCKNCRACLASCIVAMTLAFPADSRAGTSTTAPADPGISCFDPAEWIGRYPSARAAGRPRFLDLSCIRKPLQTMLPASELRRLLETMQVDSPVRMSGQYMIVARCEAHACPADHAMVFIDVQRGDLVVGIYRRTARGAATHWYSRERDPLELPPELLQEFLRQHTPAP